jgi:hypothetical protein
MSESKRRGEWAELAFMARAAALGFTISKPLGDCARYDVILEKHGVTLRVQVKSVSVMFQNNYRVHTATGPSATAKRYNSTDTDFLACYVIPEDAWYIVPVDAVCSVPTIYLHPHRASRSRFEIFREAWHLLEPVPALVLP